MATLKQHVMPSDQGDPDVLKKEKKAVDTETLNHNDVLEKVEEVRKHGFGEVRVEIFKGEVRSILVTQSWRRKVEDASRP